MTSLHQSSSWLLSGARIGGAGREQESHRGQAEGGERGARDGNIFEVEQARELPIDLGVGGSSPSTDPIQMAGLGPHHQGVVPLAGTGK